MKACIPIILTLCWLTSANAQGVLWDKLYGGLKDVMAFDMKATNDGGFVVVGHKSDSSRTIFLMKLDQSGDSTWSRVFPFASSGQGVSVEVLADGFLIAANYTDFVEYKEKAILVRTTPAGDTVWTRRISFAGDHHASKLIISGDNFSVLLTAYFGGTSEARVLRYNLSGQFLWSRGLSSASNTSASDFLHSPDGGYWVLASEFGPAEPYFAIFKLDNLGFPVDTTDFRRTGGIYSPKALWTNSDELLVSATLKGPSGDEDVRFFLLDSSLNVLQSQDFQSADRDVILHSIEVRDGFMSIGYRHAPLNSSTSDVVLLRTDRSLALLGLSRISSVERDIGNKLLLLSNGSIVVLGNRHITSLQENIWLFAVSAEYLTTVAAPTIPENVTPIRLFPNPANPSTSIEVHLEQDEEVRISLVDLLGRTLWVGGPYSLPRGTHHQPIPTDRFPSGVYLAHVVAESWFATARIVVLK